MDLMWTHAGRRFGAEDLVHWRRRKDRSLEAAIDDASIVVLGPHASAAFPQELKPFINPDLTLRRQLDYSDWLTGYLGRCWAEASDQVIFIENPHSRVVLDPNRAPSECPMETLKLCFQRLRDVGPNAPLGGVDFIRPVTFGGWPVLLEPKSAQGWQALEKAWSSAAALGAMEYLRLSAQIVEACARRCASVQRRLVVFSLHDTMNHKMGPDGAINIERPVADRLPFWVNLGNLGDPDGGALPDSALSMDTGAARQMASTFLKALTAIEPGAAPEVTLNQPYKGARETQVFGASLAQAGLPSGSGAIQIEFRRESLLGTDATALLMSAGSDWPPIDVVRLQSIAKSLARHLTVS